MAGLEGAGSPGNDQELQHFVVPLRLLHLSPVSRPARRPAAKGAGAALGALLSRQGPAFTLSISHRDSPLVLFFVAALEVAESSFSSSSSSYFILFLLLLPVLLIVVVVLIAIFLLTFLRRSLCLSLQ